MKLERLIESSYLDLLLSILEDVVKQVASEMYIFATTSWIPIDLVLLPIQMAPTEHSSEAKELGQDLGVLVCRGRDDT